jgi:hypothetical protein
MIYIHTHTYAVAIDRSLADPILWGCPVGQGSPKKTPTFAVDSFRLNVLWDLRSNFSSNYMKAPNYYIKGNARPVTYATTYMCIIHTRTSLLLLYTVAAFMTFKLI